MGDLTKPEGRAAEDQRASAAAVERVIQYVRQDYSLRIPRSEEDRRNGFAGWLERQREQLDAVLRAAVASEGLAEDADMPETRQIAERAVWPEVAEFLLSYVVLASAGSWSSHHYYDSTTKSWPERVGNRWRVRLGVNGYEGDFGQVMLDADGNVLPDLTTTRDQILEALRGRSRCPAATTSRE